MSEEDTYMPGPWYWAHSETELDCNSVVALMGATDSVIDLCAFKHMGVAMAAIDYTPEDAALIAAAPDLLRELEEAQWVTDLDEDIQRWCPRCVNGENSGHTPDCTLAAALRKARGGASHKPGHPEHGRGVR